MPIRSQWQIEILYDAILAKYGRTDFLKNQNSKKPVFGQDTNIDLWQQIEKCKYPISGFIRQDNVFTIKLVINTIFKKQPNFYLQVNNT